MSKSIQQISPFRREYNAWVANETIEDYALRFTPRRYRKWSELRVANTAFGAVSFLALEAIGATIALRYGFTNALCAVLFVGLITFLTGLPIAYYAARHAVDMDLLTRGAGFGYLGSTITSLVYACFTFIFFALEAAIMGQALQMAFGLPLIVCYVLSAVVVVPIVTHGVTVISRLQAWTQPLWLAMFFCPFAWIVLRDPGAFATFSHLSGSVSGSSGFDPLMFGTAATVAFSLVVQIGEQVDYLRFLPEKTAENRWRWWGAVIGAGPGWILPGAAKMLAGALLASVAIGSGVPDHLALQPPDMYLAAFGKILGPGGWALFATVVFVIVSQVKINVTNAYAGSLAWSNFFARLTHSHPGRVVWLVFNVLIAMLLMALDIFGALERVLGIYANFAIAWVGALVADLLINKPLGLSPAHLEFKRAHLYDLNPVGLGAMLMASALAVFAYTGELGPTAEAFSPFIALCASMAIAPVIAWFTSGRYYLARSSTRAWKPGARVRCGVCGNDFESEDMASCPAYDTALCSLCCTLESRCMDVCKKHSQASEQLLDAVAAIAPAALARRLNVRIGHFVVLLASLCAVIGLIVGLVYVQEQMSSGSDALAAPFVKVFALMAMAAAVCAWWVVLASESRRIAQDESSRQNRVLMREIEAHGRTDAAFRAAKESAESANQAKTRYVAGITHELRTPLNSILGYAQILSRDERIPADARDAVLTLQRSGEHLHALVDGLLDLATIEAGRLRLDIAPVPLRDLLDDMVRMVEPQAQSKGLEFNFETRGRIPSVVRADAKRLRQILLNLLGNAIRFTDRGTVTLRVDARQAVMRFDVIDTGIGIEPQDLERIFLPFERGSAGRRASAPGTGLGLTVTNLLTELMGGELSVESTPGEGSVFSLRMYLREPDVAVPSWQPSYTSYRPVVGYAGPRRTLLVVDDQPVQRQMLAGMLAPLGFQIRESASGTECLESVRVRPPDAVLLDVSMDEMDGWKTARSLRDAGYRDLPIIMVSASVFENQPDRLIESGVQAFVAKPVVESELLAALSRHLKLEWETERPATLPSSPPAPVSIDAFSIPVEALMELRKLTLAGQPRALRRLLDALERERPELGPLCAQCRIAVDNFDFDTLLQQLKVPDDSD